MGLFVEVSVKRHVSKTVLEGHFGVFRGNGRLAGREVEVQPDDNKQYAHKNAYEESLHHTLTPQRVLQVEVRDTRVRELVYDGQQISARTFSE